MNKPLRIGLIGAGMVSRHHLIAWAQIADQARVIAVADPECGGAVTIFASFPAHKYPATQVDRLEILGETGSIRLDGPLLTCAGPSSAERRDDLAAEYQGSYNRAIAHFVQSLRDHSSFETAPDDNLETLRLVEDCYRLSRWEATQ